MSKLFLRLRSNCFNDVDHYRNTYIEYENVEDKTKIKAIYDDKKVELIRNAEFVEDFDRYTVYKKNETANYTIKVIDHDKGEVVFSMTDDSKKRVQFFEASGIVYLLFNNKYIISYTVVFGKILGGSIFYVICFYVFYCFCFNFH